MSRSQKNARLRTGAPGKQATGDADYPADVTKKDGAENVAGDVNAMSLDNAKMRCVKDPYRCRKTSSGARAVKKTSKPTCLRS